ncbi:ABC transporter permease [Clostridiaceae bacterium]|nr:ABC transporter permease [Clostridiaceae bacterium]MDE7036203.1 ABC transporter permease [Eubacteriales bacterium]NBH77537.1 ABC transporter permease [Clostridiaceae bacterium]RKJ82242.1 ABC transporter permease [Butyricicoccus sp. 1XD8-22]RKJ82434.1 ABC transporter permease [Butyricicoccus sp. 1XD8-22]
MQQKKKLRLDKFALLSIAALCAGVFIWWLVTDGLGLFRSNVLPSPVKVGQTFLRKWVETKPDGATLLQHLFASLQVALSGYLIGAAIGIPLGIFMAWNDKIDMFVRPVFDLVRTIPGIAWTSVMVTLVGIGFLSKALVIFISAMVAMVINSYSGIKQTKTVHLWVGQTFGASNWELLTRIAIPSALPMIFTGLDVALGSAWTTLVAAELLASTRGLGFMIQQARGIFRLDIVIVGMVIIAVTGALLSYAIRFLGNQLMKGGRS